MTGFDKKNSKYKFFSSDFAIINLGLDPDPDSAEYLDPDSENTDRKHWIKC
jgi:hypothetical protein